jgi:DNA (cytosine-5)-methyltransferase 1
LNYLDLFHGIGGFALGAYWAGMKFENHYCSDIEPYCQKLYKLRFPDSIQLGDITKIKSEDLPNGNWIITGGFPCQDISIAGNGAGLDGARSGLWFEYWRLIRDLRPKYAIMENVGALSFRGLDRVLGSLSEIGYDAEWQDIRASDVGAPHRRERIWIVAYPGLQRSPKHEKQTTRIKQCSKIMANSEKINDGERESESLRRQIQQFGNGNISNDVSDSNGSQFERNERSERGKQKRTNTSEHCGWSTESDVGRVAHGIPSRVDRLKGLGNAIVPQIAEIIFRQIKDLPNERIIHKSEKTIQADRRYTEKQRSIIP